MQSFVPHPRLRYGHLRTVFAWGRTRPPAALPHVETRLFQVEPDAQVSADCFWQPDRAAHPAIILLHGLEGSSAAHYMIGIAGKAYAAGFSAVLLNQRNCGGTEHLAPGLYHSGLTHDARHVLNELTTVDGISRVAIAGYSLGGNLALKLAGEYGAEAPKALRAVCAVSPILEISQCVHALERPRNVIYQWNFVRGLRARMRRKSALFPGRFPVDRLRQVRTVRQFDEVFTAPHFGFRDAEDYYHRASAMRVVDRITVPTLIIAAQDDPFVPASMFEQAPVRNNRHITTVVTRHGGHCGFVAARDHGGDDGYWAESAIVTFAATHV